MEANMAKKIWTVTLADDLINSLRFERLEADHHRKRVERSSIPAAVASGGSTKKFPSR